MLEATIGECNNADRNFHEPGADAKTAKVHRASQAAIKLADSGTGVFEKNIDDGGCAPHFDAAGNKHYTPEQREAMRNTALVAYDKVSETFPATEVLLVERFGNFQKTKHRRCDGTPVVTMEAATATWMVILSVVVKHLSLAPGDTDAFRSIVEGRSALKAAGVRALEWRKGKLDLEGLLADYTDADRIKGVLDLLHILVTAEQEPAEYRESLRVEKTKKMVQMIHDLRREESLAAVLAGVEGIAKLWMPRGYTFTDRSNGGERHTCCRSTSFVVVVVIVVVFAL